MVSISGTFSRNINKGFRSLQLQLIPHEQATQRLSSPDKQQTTNNKQQTTTLDISAMATLKT